MTEIEQTIEAYKYAKEQYATSKLALDIAKLHFENEHMDVIQAFDLAKARLGAIENALRLEASQEYQVTGNKTIAEGITVREVEEIGYEAKDAIEYCIKHNFLNGFDLNKTAFKKIAIATRPSFVTFKKVPEVRLSRSL